MEFTGAIVMCPVCSTGVDAQDWGLQEFSCSTCGTEFTVNLEPEKVSQNALYG